MQSSKIGQARDLVRRFGMHPGTALYRHLGLLFYKYLGSADVTFKQLYDFYGVERTRSHRGKGGGGRGQGKGEASRRSG